MDEWVRRAVSSRRLDVEQELVEARAALTRAEDEVTRMRGYVASLAEERTELYRALIGPTKASAGAL